MLVEGVVRRVVGRLPMRFRGAFLLLLVITLIDFLVPDVIPFVDEIILALLTVLLGLWRDRRAAKPPRATMLLVLSLIAAAAVAGCSSARDGGSERGAAPGVERSGASTPDDTAPALVTTEDPKPAPPSAPVDSPPGPANPWSRAARDALVAPCGRCHQSTLPTADPKALAVFDLDQPAWSATMSRDQIESLGGRARGSTRLGPDEKDAVERFVRCALEGECSEG